MLPASRAKMGLEMSKFVKVPNNWSPDQLSVGDLKPAEKPHAVGWEKPQRDDLTWFQYSEVAGGGRRFRSHSLLATRPDS